MTYPSAPLEGAAKLVNFKVEVVLFPKTTEDACDIGSSQVYSREPISGANPVLVEPIWSKGKINVPLSIAGLLG